MSSLVFSDLQAVVRIETALHPKLTHINCSLACFLFNMVQFLVNSGDLDDEIA